MYAQKQFFKMHQVIREFDLTFFYERCITIETKCQHQISSQIKRNGQHYMMQLLVLSPHKTHLLKGHNLTVFMMVMDCICA